MKKFIVVKLEQLCNVIDSKIIPYLPEKLQMYWYCQPAELSARLDEKWKTGEWS